MIVYYLISIGLMLAYGLLMLDIYGEWLNQEDYLIPDNYSPQTPISVVIAARNEEANIEQCLETILQNDYPENLLEIIVVDDHSEDQTADLIANYEEEGVRLIQQTDPNVTGKKMALQKAVENASHNLIVTTDADCMVRTKWLQYHSFTHEIKKAECVTGPVEYIEEDSMLEKFQSLDLIGMMGVTQAGIFSDKWYLANGANMSFKKETFLEVEALKKSKKWASGDDVFLIQSIAKEKGDQVYFLKNFEASVATKAETNWKSFIQQRMRWATKNKGYETNNIAYTLGLVFIFCLSIVVNFLCIPIFGEILLFIAVFQLFVKLIIDYLYLGNLSRYFEKENLMKSFWYSSPLYILYIVGIGIYSLFASKYTWKGRKVS